MYVCMYMYTYMYVCRQTFLSLYTCMHVHRQIYMILYVCKYAWPDVDRHVCMYICMDR